MRKFALLGIVFLLSSGSLSADDEAKTRILLLGKDRDHAFGTHEYMTDCQILAKCLRQTPGIETVVSNGWPKDSTLVKNVKAIVLHTRNGGNVLFDPILRARVEALLKNGVGLTAIHWSTGADDKTGELWRNTLGGWFNSKFSKLNTRTTRIKQAAPDHPICRGWKEYEMKDEYYLQLKFMPEIKPVLQVEIDKQTHTVGWVYERPESKGGRSFGCVCGHFHANFGEKEFRQALVNGILWTAHVEVPKEGAPVAITAKDLELPPPEVPPRKGKAETINLFDGKTLDGWQGYDDLWSVKDGVIVAKNTKPLKYSTYLVSKRKFTDFRLLFSAKLVESEMHSGVALWGQLFVPKDCKDPIKEKAEFTYQGHLVMFPSGWGLFDLYRRMGAINPAKNIREVAVKAGKQHGWNDMEILAQGNRIRLAVNGKAVLDWRDPEPKLIKEGPIGLQLHSNNIPQEVHFKGLVLTTFPEEKLVTVK